MCSPVAGGARLTDTLATTTEGEPLLFQSKAWVIPHLNMAVVITGIANFGASWNEYLRSSLMGRDLTWWLIGRPVGVGVEAAVTSISGAERPYRTAVHQG